MGSLVLNFEAKRVTRASTKNIVIKNKEGVCGVGCEGYTPGSRRAADEQVMFQFGKYGLGKYALDFKAPLAPIQVLPHRQSNGDACALTAHTAAVALPLLRRWR